MRRAMIKSVCGFLVLLLLTTTATYGIAAETGQTEPRVRLWSSKAGTYLRATFVRVEGENVVLLKEEGGEVSVPTTQLSWVDQEYVEKQKVDDAPPAASGKVDGATGSSELLEKCQQLSEQLTKTYKVATAGAKPTIAVVEFSDLSGGVTDLGRLISEELITTFVSSGNYKVIERFLLNKAIAEHKLQLQGIVDPASAKELGKILGVDVIVSGTIADMSGYSRVNARLLATETGEVFAAAAVTISNFSVSPGGGFARPPTDPPMRQKKYQIPMQEDFSGYQEGAECDWGNGILVKTREDKRKWLAPTIEGQQPIQPNIVLPGSAYIQFDYDVQPLVSNQPLGRILSSISLIDESGARFKIEWFFVNPASSFQVDNTIRFPGVDAGRLATNVTSGTLRISIQGDKVTVSVEGGQSLSATVLDFKKFTRFEVDLYRGQNGVLFVTNFKVGNLPSSPRPRR